MPKQSYAQEVAALEETVAAARSLAGVLPPLALTVAGEVAAQIAVIKELKRRQRAYAAEHREVAAAKRAAMARGMVAARDIRACVVLVYGPKDARITRFGLRIRRGPARMAATASPAGPVETGFTAVRTRSGSSTPRGRTVRRSGGRLRQWRGMLIQWGETGRTAGETLRPSGGRTRRSGRSPRPLGRERPRVGERFRTAGKPSDRRGKLRNGP